MSSGPGAIRAQMPLSDQRLNVGSDAKTHSIPLITDPDRTTGSTL